MVLICGVTLIAAALLLGAAPAQAQFTPQRQITVVVPIGAGGGVDATGRLVAEKLSDSHLETLKSTLKTVTGGKEVDLNVKVDPAIIGGLTVKVGSRMIDSSLRTKLNAIKHAMKEAG